MSRRQDACKIEIPDIVLDPKTRKKYKKGKFLGRGGFAKCFELIDMQTNEIFAGKVVAKAQLQKSEQKEKMSQEIAIQRSLNHNHVVKFYTYFEDVNYIYIILELCNKRSLMEMHKRRKTLTDAEVKYFIRQICLAGQYLHDNRIIHRDLKLGNLFLNDLMELKVGDFGLAAKIATEGERKLTLCGTPNYIAPEVLLKKGHSYEVDSWSLGCIVYTLVVGKPPFETNDLKDTYKRIRHNDYHIPKTVNADAQSLIRKLLHAEPSKRPTMSQVLKEPFMLGYIPSKLPISCLTISPRYNDGRLSIMPPLITDSPRRPLGEMNQGVKAGTSNAIVVGAKPQQPAAVFEPSPKDSHLRELAEQLKRVIASKPELKLNIIDEDAEDPAATPIFWISKWVDYTDKYGLGYQLCDNSYGVLFNDMTRLVMLSDGHNLQYMEKDNSEQYFTMSDYDSTLNKKVTLLSYFCNYMNDHLLKTGEKIKPDKLAEGEIASRLPSLSNWFRTRNAIVFHLTNGTVQVNFFKDHTKVILCPLMGAVTYVNEKREFKTYRFNLIEKLGCGHEVIVRIKYASEVTARLMVHKLKSNTRGSK